MRENEYSIIEVKNGFVVQLEPSERGMMRDMSETLVFSIDEQESMQDFVGKLFADKKAKIKRLNAPGAPE